MAMQNLSYNSSQNKYLLQQVNSAGPEKLISLLYDIGSKSCRAKDRQKAAKVLVELIAALNFDYKEIATDFFDLYRYALDEVNKGGFENALRVFEELNDVWKSAVMKNPSNMN